MVVPSQCCDCDCAIVSSKAVLLHCECCIAFCVSCALQQMSLSDETYNSSISCPKCGGTPSEGGHHSHPQILLRSKELAESTEDAAICSAFRWIGKEDYQRKMLKDKVRFSLSYHQTQCLRVSSVCCHQSSQRHAALAPSLPFAVNHQALNGYSFYFRYLPMRI